MFTFVGNLLTYLERHGIAATREPGDAYDVLFANSWVVPYETVHQAKRSHPDIRVVQRVDGASKDYGGYAGGDRRQARVNLLADVTVFQSAYSKYSTTAKYRVIHQDGPIIFNPVDLGLFAPDGPERPFPPGRIRVACASWSVNRRKGTWQIADLARLHPDVDFVLCGRFEGIPIADNIVRLGHVSRVELARTLRGCDVFLNLSEHDPAPNVVIEALASGLPVLFHDSGGVSELVGDCGIATSLDRFRASLDDALSRRNEIGVAARARAERLFAPEVVFPQYLRAMEQAVRRPLPSSWDIARLAFRGYPVLPRLADGARIEEPPRQRLPRRVNGRAVRIGWATYDSFLKSKREVAELDSFTGMRAGNMITWLNANTELRNEIFRPGADYDVVVFQKVMGRAAEREVERLQAAGTRVVFDANVNYYEIWGDYDVAETKPTREQQRAAVWMTRRADWVVADSSYLAGIIRKLTPRVTWIPDNVDPNVYGRTRDHRAAPTLTLIWSGIAKKAAHLRVIESVLAAIRNVEVVIVSDREAAAAWLPRSTARRFIAFSETAYAQALLEADAIISPKHLSNGYEMAHTEYKISLGMAAGLPAIASPQPSYIEAIDAYGAGAIARTPQEWTNAFERLRDPQARSIIGAAAQRTVFERYSTPVVARQYAEVLRQLVEVTTAAPHAVVNA